MEVDNDINAFLMQMQLDSRRIRRLYDYAASLEDNYLPLHEALRNETEAHMETGFFYGCLLKKKL